MLKATPIQRKYVQNLTTYLLKVVYCGEMQIFLDLWELHCCMERQSEESNLFVVHQNQAMTIVVTIIKALRRHGIIKT